MIIKFIKVKSERLDDKCNNLEILIKMYFFDCVSRATFNFGDWLSEWTRIIMSCIKTLQPTFVR